MQSWRSGIKYRGTGVPQIRFQIYVQNGSPYVYLLQYICFSLKNNGLAVFGAQRISKRGQYSDFGGDWVKFRVLGFPCVHKIQSTDIE